MVTEKQQRDIKKLMRAVKDAVDDDMSEEEVKKRTHELTNYLHQQGIINPFDD